MKTGAVSRRKTALVHSDRYGEFDYGPEHPLRMERLSLTWRLMQAYGLTTLPNAVVRAPEPASEAEVAAFHTQDYIDVLKAADSGRTPREAERYGLGRGDNPVFPGVWRVAQLVAGGSLLAADLVGRGEVERAFHFAGGLHHAHASRASGFCYVNDPVLAILRLRRHGLRVAYVDIDAHHGDGVQEAFYGDPDVLTVSTHERGDRLFPGTGFVDEVGEGEGVGYSVNLPLEAFTDSEIFLEAFEEVVPPLLAKFAPDAIVAQLGIDAHRTDPLTHLALDIQGFVRAVGRIAELAPRLVALGGGGYDLRNVARGWTLSWAVLNDLELPAEMPAAFHDDLARYEFETNHLLDESLRLHEDTRRRVAEYVSRQVAAVKRVIFPLHGL
jgi:acetoin utilization protein AcuC